MIEQPIDILEHYWGFSTFRPLQEDIINAVLDNEDTFALLPTGGGKSICFQIPALIKEGICIVVSPLIALMHDQVEQLNKMNIRAMAISSKFNYQEIDIMLDNCIYGNYKFLYLSPERLKQEIVQERIKQMNVNLIAVDEAHCISQWGNDFRPAYKHIPMLRELHPSVNIIALTASATEKVVDDTINALDFIDGKIFKQSFHRDNLAYMVFSAEDKLYRISTILAKNPGSSIIYVRSRKQTVSISQHLEQQGFTSVYYHGGLTADQKEEQFRKWKNNSAQVMVATNAFGMGIDKSDVRTVIHINLPESIESYFQEAGRAGRDQQKAYAILLKNEDDDALVQRQFLSVLPTVKEVKEVYRKLSNYFQISYGDGEATTHDFNFAEFCKKYAFNTLKTFNALQLLDRTSIISLSTLFNKNAMVQVLVASDALFEYINSYPDHALIVKSVLRTYGGVFDHEVAVNTVLIADKASTEEDKVIEVLKHLVKKELITLRPRSTDAQITFLEPREDDLTINRIAKTIEQQHKLKHDQVNAMLEYSNNDTVCKNKQLLTYFGESQVTNCGICSVCISKRSRPSMDMEKAAYFEILNVLRQKTMTSRAIAQHTGIEEQLVTSSLKSLLENNKIEITESNTYRSLEDE